MLQETHSTPEDEERWQKEWGGTIIFSHGSSSSRGTCIMFSKDMDTNMHQIVVDQNGRYVILDITINDVRLTLVNLYGPNKDDEEFYINLFEQIELIGNDNRIIAGDFNTILDNAKDKKGGKLAHANINTQQLLNIYMDETDLIDIWRIQHPEQSTFTYHAAQGGRHIFSRIDFILLSLGLTSLVTKSIISPNFLSDHSPVELKIKLEDSRRGNGFWKLNCGLLKDTEYVIMIKQTIQDTVEMNNEIGDALKWEMIKMAVRGKSIKYSSRKKRSTNNTLTALQRRLENLKVRFETRPDPDIERDMQLVQTDIELIVENQVKGAQIRAKLNWINEGERPTKFFLNIEKQNYNKKHIKRILKPGGDTISGPSNILNELELFYMNLYTSIRTPRHIIPNFDETLANIETDKLTELEKLECEGMLTENELFEALKTTKSNKTPGNDGLSSEFYKLFWMDIKQYLVRALNNSYENKTLSITQKRGIITLLPKKGRNILELKNWRPITLLNQDYKLATKCIAKRICKHLPKIINPDQTGFIKGRFIGENIFKILNIMEYIVDEEMDSLLINIDFEKAFDIIEWDCIDYCLKLYYFGESLKQ